MYGVKPNLLISYYTPAIKLNLESTLPRPSPSLYTSLVDYLYIRE